MAGFCLKLAAQREHEKTYHIVNSGVQYDTWHAVRDQIVVDLQNDCCNARVHRLRARRVQCHCQIPIDCAIARVPIAIHSRFIGTIFVENS